MRSYEVYQQLLSNLEAGRACRLETVLEESKTGRVEKCTTQMEKKQGEGFRKDEGVLVERGNGKILLSEPFYPEERLIVLGGGHVAVPLVEAAAGVGFSVTVVDDRPSFANTRRFPGAKRVICDGFRAAIGKLRITPYDYVAILTRGHRYDLDCLREILKGPFPFYLGMIGSERRVSGVKEMLQEEGFRQEELRTLCAPIGLNIGAVTPEEIGISITAQLICKRRLLQVREAKRKCTVVGKTEADLEVIRELAEEGNARAVATIISSKGPTPRKAGAKMIIYPDGRISGSIGGGCSEQEVIRRARRLVGTGGWEIYTVDLQGDVAENDGMVCGGILEVLIEDDV